MGSERVRTVGVEKHRLIPTVNGAEGGRSIISTFGLFPNDRATIRGLFFVYIYIYCHIPTRSLIEHADLLKLDNYRRENRTVAG